MLLMLSRTQRAVARSAFRTALRLEASGKQIWLQLPPSSDEFQTHRYTNSTEEALQEIYPPAFSSLIGTFPTRLIDGSSLRMLIRSAFRMNLDDHHNPDDEALRGLRVLNVQKMLSESTSIQKTECGEHCKVRVVVTSVYDTERSDDAREHRVFYRVLFENEGNDVVQLMGRHWIFVCGDRIVSEVPKFGEGVIGLYPTLKPGQAFQYMSCCTLPDTTHGGEMHGSFQFSNITTGDIFEVGVAPNQLIIPSKTRKKEGTKEGTNK